MQNHSKSRMTFFTTASRIALIVALIAAGANAAAGEGYKLRQSPVGVFGGEMAAPADNTGFFGTIGLTYSNIYKVVDENGDKISVVGRAVSLPTNTQAHIPVPDGTYTLNVPAGTIDFKQSQTPCWSLPSTPGVLSKPMSASGQRPTCLEDLDEQVKTC